LLHTSSVRMRLFPTQTLDMRLRIVFLSQQLPAAVKQPILKQPAPVKQAQQVFIGIIGRIIVRIAVLTPRRCLR